MFLFCCSFLFLLFFYTVALLLCVSRCKYPATSQYNSTTVRGTLAPPGGQCWWVYHSTLHWQMCIKLPHHLPSSSETAEHEADIPFQLFYPFFFSEKGVCFSFRKSLHSLLATQWPSTARWLTAEPFHFTLKPADEMEERWDCNEDPFVMAFKRVRWRVWPLLLHGPVFKVKRGLFLLFFRPDAS